MHNKVIFITGGNAGMGLAAAKLFASQGAKVAIFGRREDKNLEAVRLLQSLGTDCISFTGDVTDEKSVNSAVIETCRKFDGLHYAFNNAGVNQPGIPLEEQELSDYQRIMDTNVKGVWLCLRAQAPLIAASGGGCIVNNSSMAGLVGFPGLTLYAASKHAVNGITKSVALEYARRNVRVNSVCPGPVQTDLYPEISEQVESMQPIGRSSTADDIATAVLYLCRDANTTTGHCMAIDGGYTAG